MKKLAIIFMCAAAFAAAPASAGLKDSAWMSSESVLSSQIEQGGTTTPIGMVSIWAGNDPIPADYLECDGQIVDAEKYPAYVAKFGNRTPDYKGFFLRGHGGKSGEIGAEQGDALQTNGYDSVNIKGMGQATVDYVSNIDYTAPTLSVEKKSDAATPAPEYATYEAYKSGACGFCGASAPYYVYHAWDGYLTPLYYVSLGSGGAASCGAVQGQIMYEGDMVTHACVSNDKYAIKGDGVCGSHPNGGIVVHADRSCSFQTLGCALIKLVSFNESLCQQDWNAYQASNPPAKTSGVKDVSMSAGSLSSTKAVQTALTKASGQVTSGLLMDMPNPAGETRPVNKAVKYIVKVK